MVKFGWTGLVLLSVLAVLLGAGYGLGLLDDYRPLLSKLVTSSGDDGKTDLIGEPSSINRAREASRFAADSIAQASVAVPVEVSAGPPAETSDRAQVARLMQLLEKSEATWTEGYNAERERADGIARDLASVRAELADRIAAEAAARAEVARMAKLLEAKEAEWSKKLAAERQKSEGVAKEPNVRAELADRPASGTSARVLNTATSHIDPASATTDALKSVSLPNPVQTTIDRGRSSSFTTLFGFESRSRALTQVGNSQGLAKRERHSSRSLQMRKPAQKRPVSYAQLSDSIQLIAKQRKKQRPSAPPKNRL